MDWPYRYNPHIWPLLATTAFLWLLGLYSWRRRSVPGALYFVLVGFSAGMWAIFATLQLLSSDLTARFFWWRLQLWIQGVPSISVFFFVVAYAGLGRWLTRRNLALIATPPLAAAALLIYTNNLHRWMWTEVIEGEYLGAIYAPGFWSLFAYVYLLYLVETGILIWLFVRSPLHRWPVAVILAGQLFIRIVHSLDAAGQGPRWPYDPVILAFNVAAICYALALFRFRIFDVLPLAR